METHILTLMPVLVVFTTELFVCKATSTAVSHCKWRRDTALDDHISESGYRSSVYTRSRYDCGWLCYTDGHCYSFFYNNNTAVCRLEGTIKLSTTGLSYQQGTSYYVMTDAELSQGVCPPDDNDFHVVKMPDSSYIRFRAFRNSKVSRSDADSLCSSYGGRIFQPIGQVKQTFLESLTACQGYRLSYWLDGKRDGLFDSQWTTWDDSHAYTQVNWQIPYPDGPLSEFCLQTALTGRWNDVGCFALSYVLCERDL